MTYKRPFHIPSLLRMTAYPLRAVMCGEHTSITFALLHPRSNLPSLTKWGQFLKDDEGSFLRIQSKEIASSFRSLQICKNARFITNQKVLSLLAMTAKRNEVTSEGVSRRVRLAV